jgi:hypothetical protein
VTENWSEDTATWISPWSSPGGDFDTSRAYAQFIPGQRNCYLSLDLTYLVQLWVNGNYPNYGVLLYSTGQYHTVEYASKEYSQAPERQPRLEVIYATPAP